MEQDDLVANVMAVTGCDDAEARFHLDASGWNVEMAVAQLLDSGQGNDLGSSSLNQEDEIRAPDRVKQQRLLVEEGMFHRDVPQAAARPGAFADYRTETRDENDNLDELAISPGGEEDDDGAAPSSQPAAGGASSGDTLSRLFAMPTQLMHAGDFQSARREAKAEKKWLLVCIIDDADFKCVAMNRDCWADETVQAIVQSQFVLWLRPHLDQEAIVYADRYDSDRTLPAAPREGDDAISSSRRQLFSVHPKHPHLGIVDPRTGRRLWMREGALDADRLIEVLSDVSDRHSMDDEPRGPPPPHPPTPQDLPPTVSPQQQPPPPPPEEVAVTAPWDTASLGGEPETGGVLINFRLVDRESGQQITRKRRFEESERVSALFKFAQQETAAGSALFELRAGFPPKQLWQIHQQTIVQADLMNQSVHMKFSTS